MTLEQACPPEYQRAQCAFKDSMIHDFCNSHYLSHFAAFFIDARTKRSVVESFSYLFLYSDSISFKRVGLGLRRTLGRQARRLTAGAEARSAKATE